MILPAVILSGFLGDIRLDIVRNPISRTGPVHVVTAGSMRSVTVFVGTRYSPPSYMARRKNSGGGRDGRDGLLRLGDGTPVVAMTSDYPR